MAANGTVRLRAALDVLGESLRIGVTSFGGPIAHIGYLHDRYVTRRGWVTEEGFADIVALCQSLPGPASSQVNMAIGMGRAGVLGGLAAWIGFTLPSAAFLTAVALLVGTVVPADAGWLHGIMLAAVAVVAQAVLAMAKRLTPDAPRALMAIGAAILALLFPYPFAQPAIIVAAGVIGRFVLPRQGLSRGEDLPFAISRACSIGSLIAFAVLLGGLPAARAL
ncbi:MAG TPA: chromate transporter, partial [Spirochaetia bacterium]